MADIGNIAGLSIRPNQDLSLADVELQSKPTIQGALPSSLAPLATIEQHQIIGASFKTSDSLRLEPLGKLTTTQSLMMHLTRAIDRIKQPSHHPFSAIEAKAAPILRQQLQMTQQMIPELSRGRT